ncbi:hypothetical protein [Reyranella sp. CPCC 100927]|uniref:hypothetical protein n=1 Tax=Reyranella sp. CPCC 100927 TaxID=2599616 RepID=UPI0011B6E64B|nr:hypothetical protein [Reyranella sp. CPCC 100927]TWT10637.1 hypothetical protein FQU96_16085 [Reyranella sp. CPCC 100927]
MTIKTTGFEIDATAGLYVRVGRYDLHTIKDETAPLWATLRQPKTFTVFMGRRRVVLSKG